MHRHISREAAERTEGRDIFTPHLMVRRALGIHRYRGLLATRVAMLVGQAWSQDTGKME